MAKPKVSLMRSVGTGLLNVFFPLVGAAIDKRALDKTARALDMGKSKPGEFQVEALRGARGVRNGSFWGALGGTVVGLLLFTPYVPMIGSLGSTALAGVGGAGAFGVSAFLMVTAAALLGRIVGSIVGGRPLFNYMQSHIKDSSASEDTVIAAQRLVNNYWKNTLFTAFFGSVANAKRNEPPEKAPEQPIEMAETSIPGDEEIFEEGSSLGTRDHNLSDNNTETSSMGVNGLPSSENATDFELSTEALLREAQGHVSVVEKTLKSANAALGASEVLCEVQEGPMESKNETDLRL